MSRFSMHHRVRIVAAAALLATFAANAQVDQQIEQIGRALDKAGKDLAGQAVDATQKAGRKSARNTLGMLMFWGAVLSRDELETVTFEATAYPALVQTLFGSMDALIRADPERDAMIEGEMYSVNHGGHRLECQRQECLLTLRENPSDVGRNKDSQKLAHDLYEGLLLLEDDQPELVRRVALDPTVEPKRYGLNAFNAGKYQAEFYLAAGEAPGPQVACGQLSRWKKSPRYACFYLLDVEP